MMIIRVQYWLVDDLLFEMVVGIDRLNLEMLLSHEARIARIMKRKKRLIRIHNEKI
jgi:hypothetical protein